MEGVDLAVLEHKESFCSHFHDINCPNVDFKFVLLGLSSTNNKEWWGETLRVTWPHSGAVLEKELSGFQLFPVEGGVHS